MKDTLAMSHEWSLRDGLTSGAGTLCRFKASGLPGETEAFLVNVRSTPDEPLWRIEGEANWRQFKKHCHETETVLHFFDGTNIAIDLSEYSPTLSDLQARWLHPNVDEALRGWC
jgi:hypothetical protein